MPSEPEKLIASVTERDSVTALLYPPAKKDRSGITLLLGHGAGADQLSSFMRMFASGMAERGFDAMTFNFLYKEQGRGAPDPKAKLEACYRSVIEAALSLKKLKGNHLIIGGKSMGGRIASQVAALDAEGISGLVFLGYPLHPPGRPDKMRDEHLKEIRPPMLCFQGSRDAFGTADELRAVIKRDKLPMTLNEIEGGDHSFKVPKSAKLTQQEVHELIMDTTARWARTQIA
ncbi:MAG TPA: alpha/beta fold hydrolase [Pyrinomonadaceae bacterium]|nr:alpha/beta fold hydrolase [Pyrinomonadaceae bacterium]